MRMWKVIVSSLVIGSLSAPLLAQDGGSSSSDQPSKNTDRPGTNNGRGRGPGGPGGGFGGPTLSPEASKAAWDVEANSVAKQLNLDADKTAALVKAYETARTSHAAAMEKAMKEARDAEQKSGGDEDNNGDDRRARFEKMRETMTKVNADEKAKFSKELANTLGSSETTKAADALGGFDRGWDNMVNTITGFKLDADKQDKALAAVQTYVASSAKARTGSDFEAMRTAMQEYRENLNASLKPILTDDQLKKFQQATGRGGPGGGGGRGNRT